MKREKCSCWYCLRFGTCFGDRPEKFVQADLQSVCEPFKALDTDLFVTVLQLGQVLSGEFCMVCTQ